MRAGIINGGRRAVKGIKGMKTNLFRNWRRVLAFAVVAALAAGVPGFGPMQAAAQSTADGVSGGVNSDAMADAPLTNQLLNNSTMATAGPSAPVTPPNVQLYGGTAEMAKLAQAGVGENVMLSYVSNSAVRFALTSDQIIYLNDLGVSGPVITAMLQHDAAANAGLPLPATTPDTAANPPSDQPVPDNNVTQLPPATPAVYPDPGYPPGYTDQAPQYPADYPAFDDAGYFYDSLAPYGNWINVAGYGLCWQPTVVVGNHGWRPYGDRGRWLYTDSGWYWQSDYSWGWAAFHYGRWTREANLGWVWVPNRVWGPGWVSWRSTGDYAGWAPLPPSAEFNPGVGFSFQNRRVGAGFDFGLESRFYTFVPVERLSDYSPVRYGVTRTVGAKIFGESVVVNNLALVNQQVVNLGINPQRVEAAGGTPVRRALVHDAAAGDNRFRTDRLEKRGDSLVISRPRLPAVNSTVASSIRRQAAATATGVPLARSTTAAISAARATKPQSAATLADVADKPTRVHVTYYRQSELTPAESYSAPAENRQLLPTDPVGQRFPTEPRSAANDEALSPAPETDRATSYPLAPREDIVRTRPRSDNTSSRSDGQTGRIGNVPTLFSTDAIRNHVTEGDVPRRDAGRTFTPGPGQTMPARQGPPSGGEVNGGYSRPPSAPTYSPPSSRAESSYSPAPSRSQAYSAPAQSYSGPSQSSHGSAPASSSSPSSSSGRNR